MTPPRAGGWALIWTGLGLFILATGMTAGAIADPWPKESSPATVPVYDMPRPDYTAPGIMLGSLNVLPAAKEDVALDDNIFATSGDAQFDLINTTSESLGWGSQWSRHEWTGRLYGDQEVFKNHDRESANTFGAETMGRLDITRDAGLQLEGSFVRQPQSRASIQADTGRGERPIYDTSSVAATLGQQFNQWSDKIQIGLRRIDYVTPDNDSREGRRDTVRNRLGFDFSDRFGLYFDAEHEAQKWDDRSDLRNSTFLTALVGVRVEVPTLVRGRVGVGALHQSFKNDAFEPLTTPVIRGEVVWNVRPLTSVLASVDRTATGTETFCGTGGGCGASRRDSLTISSAELGLEHELYHDLLGRVRFRYERDEFSRNELLDKTYTAMADLRYLLNRNLEISVEYTHRSRVANLPFDRTFNSGPFTENILGLFFRAAL